MDENNVVDEEFSNIIVLNDENGNEVQFEFLDLIEYESEQFVVLLPVLEEGQEDDGEVVILKVDDSEENADEESYVSVDDEETLQVSKFECEYRATRREEMTNLLLAHGCSKVDWKFPEETGFYQPIVVAKKV